jgi:hypothetical protein
LASSVSLKLNTVNFIEPDQHWRLVNEDELLLERIQVSFVGSQSALDTGLLVCVGKLARDKDFLASNDFEGFSNQVGKRSSHDRLEIAIVLLLKNAVVKIDSDFRLLFCSLQDQHLVALLTLSNRFVESNDECHVHIIRLGK